MLSCQQKLTKRLIKLRLVKGLSQHQVAKLAGFCQPYLAQVERGVRPISVRALQLLETVYGKKVSASLRKGVGRRGSPRLTAATRQALKEMAAAIRSLWKDAETQKPRHPQAHQVRRSSDPLWPMALHLSLEARQEVELLEKLRAEDEQFWRQFNSAGKGRIAGRTNAGSAPRPVGLLFARGRWIDWKKARTAPWLCPEKQRRLGRLVPAGGRQSPLRNCLRGQPADRERGRPPGHGRRRSSGGSISPGRPARTPESSGAGNSRLAYRRRRNWLPGLVKRILLWAHNQLPAA